MSKEKIWKLLRIADPNDPTYRASRTIDLVISALIFLSIIAVILESVPKFYKPYKTTFLFFEYFCLTLFAIEYVFGLYACGADRRYQGFAGRVRWILSPSAIIDLLAILPAFFMFGRYDLRFLRGLRLLRLFRLTRYSRGIRLITQTLKQSRKQLQITVCGAFILLIISACAIYYAENEAQPEAFATIPHSIWWAAITLTTVGYGDVSPVTVVGKTIAIFIAFIGVGLFALPSGILAANFADTLDRDAKSGRTTCPHCGKDHVIN